MGVKLLTIATNNTDTLPKNVLLLSITVVMLYLSNHFEVVPTL